MNKHEKINYIEFSSRHLNKTKTFFTTVFNWSFTDYSDEYTAFSNEGIDGGFYKDENKPENTTGCALVVFYSNDLGATQNKIENADGEIVQAIFEFPGGRRFHFVEPGGNEFAVWSDVV